VKVLGALFLGPLYALAWGWAAFVSYSISIGSAFALQRQRVAAGYSTTKAGWFARVGRVALLDCMSSGAPASDWCVDSVAKRRSKGRRLAEQHRETPGRPEWWRERTRAEVAVRTLEFL